MSRSCVAGGYVAVQILSAAIFPRGTISNDRAFVEYPSRQWVEVLFRFREGVFSSGDPPVNRLHITFTMSVSIMARYQITWVLTAICWTRWCLDPVFHSVRGARQSLGARLILMDRGLKDDKLICSRACLQTPRSAAESCGFFDSTPRARVG